jgi:hypothetical protein
MPGRSRKQSSPPLASRVSEARIKTT